MKPRHVLPPVFLFALFELAGCGNKNGPTGPIDSSIDLAGAWAGTITYPRGSGTQAVRCDSETLNSTLFQVGTSVTARFDTSCGGPLSLQASLHGNLLFGSLTGGSLGGHASGVASASRIEITVSRSSKVEVDPVCSIELTR